MFRGNIGLEYHKTQAYVVVALLSDLVLLIERAVLARARVIAHIALIHR